MYSLLEQRLRTIDTKNLHASLRDAHTGLEKESLRVSPDGGLSQTQHPAVLGSPLTHPWITTDYAESLLEMITPPQERATDALDFLLNIETFVYQQLKDELLWTTSMPCILGNGDDIRIAEFGTSNAGQMKHIYRQGLAWRYGKNMQVIAGIHFNYSIAESFWPVWQQEEDRDNLSLRDFRDRQYMGLTRNLLRYGWLIIYLFGTSPAICKSFLGGRKSSGSLQEFNASTLYEPYGTSLRMGNIGYTNSKERDTGIRVCYDSVQSYTDSLRQAIHTHSPEYAAIGVKVDGVYRQLNDNILQIENEYYSTVRPKQVLQGFEKPVDALSQRGIRYVELRSVDINAYHPAGMTRKQLTFLEVFMHFCLLQESPLIGRDEREAINHNQALVAHRGRAPGLELQRFEGADAAAESMLLSDWASELLQQMQPVAALLDKIHEDETYSQALADQHELVKDPELTPSARMLAEMRANQDEGFFYFAQRKAEEHREYFLKRQLSDELQQQFARMATESLQKQQQIEIEDKIDIDTFLERYFSGNL